MMPPSRQNLLRNFTLSCLCGTYAFSNFSFSRYVFGSVESFELECEAFQLAKHCRHSFQPSDDKSTIPFSVICSDAWVTTLEKTMFGYKYFATFTDECTRMIGVYLMKNKYKDLDMLKLFHHHVKCLYNAKIQVLFIGGEHTSKRMHTYLYEEVIVVITFCSYTP